jgi:DNA-binding SARP family transcriptional activator/tetratricopeptide (TPR) repeat protein
VQVRLLGPIDVVDRGLSRAVTGTRRKAVLAILALHCGQVVSASRLSEIVWSGAPPATAVNTLQRHVSSLRDALGSKSAIVARPPGYLLDLGSEGTDWQVAERLLQEGTRAGNSAQGVQHLRAALALWRGQALEDLAEVAGLDDESRRLAQLHLEVKRALSSARLAAGEHVALVPDLEHLAAEHPLDERVHGQLVLALYRSGRQADALARYDRLRRSLADQLGIDPSQQLRELEMAVLRQDPAIDPPAPVSTAGCASVPAGPSDEPAPADLRRKVLPPAQLPSPVRVFEGRGAELDSLDAIAREAVDAPADQRPAMAVSVIAGTAGVGKTALAVYWAHRASDWFPDGQLYVNLRGFDPAGVPLDPGEVLRGFLAALGVPPRGVPSGLDAQLGLYRSLLAGRRVLVVLDNARDADHVRSLLPGSPGCMAIVTSRTRLTPLVATEAARPLNLRMLTVAESIGLLNRRLGSNRVVAERAAADDIISRCDGLPLALAIVAARAETDPVMSLSALAGQLRDSAGALDTLTAGDDSTDLRAVFSWSTGALRPETARLYRLLGLHPGPDLATGAAASLAGEGEAAIRPRLAELVHASLLTEHVPGRFAFHDLLRAHAADQGRARDTDDDQRAATSRMLDHYLHSAQEAARLVYGPWDKLPLTDARPGVITQRFDTEAQALAWLGAEYQILLGSIELAARGGFEQYAWQLTRTLLSYFQRSGHWRDWLTAQHAAVAAACRASDLTGQAHARHGLGSVLTHLGNYQESDAELTQAVELFQSLDDQAHQGQIHLSMGFAADCQQADQAALDHCQQALALFRAASHQAGEAVTLNNMGWSEAQLGRYSEALTHCGQALRLHEQTGDRHGQAGVWDSLGYIHGCRPDHAQAIACYAKGADLYRQNHDGHNEAETLIRLGDACQAAGDRAAAEDAYRRALRLQETLEYADPAPILGRLDGTRPAEYAAVDPA